MKRKSKYNRFTELIPRFIALHVFACIRSICSNYRDVSLLSVSGKVFGHIILYRMRGGIEKKLRENQGGFRNGRGCADKIFCLLMLIEKCVEFQLPALAIFVDFKAVFDTIHSPSM